MKPAFSLPQQSARLLPFPPIRPRIEWWHWIAFAELAVALFIVICIALGAIEQSALPPPTVQAAPGATGEIAGTVSAVWSVRAGNVTQDYFRLAGHDVTYRVDDPSAPELKQGESVIVLYQDDGGIDGAISIEGA